FFSLFLFFNGVLSCAVSAIELSIESLNQDLEDSIFFLNYPLKFSNWVLLLLLLGFSSLSTLNFHLKKNFSLSIFCFWVFFFWGGGGSSGRVDPQLLILSSLGRRRLSF
ncbi:hypothetical protein PanWU01x14_090280, partial [Parasponia andersonii]